MSTQDEYAKPLAHAQALMAEQMARPENVAKESWRTTDAIDLMDAFDRNTELLFAARDRDEMWRRAANVANFAWMIADHSFPINPLSNFGDDENDRMPWQQD